MSDRIVTFMYRRERKVNDEMYMRRVTNHNFGS